MTRDDIIRMARGVGAAEPSSLYGRTDYVVMTQGELERFAVLVAAAEREACAKLCDWLNGEKRLTPAGCAALIRARSNP
jgi:hypothetical protein